jgi:scyllo-inositol 2-dehydrogenase (NAD+)
MSRIGIGVIGLGRMGRVYAYHTAQQIEGATLVAVADPSQAARDEFSTHMRDVLVHSDYHDLLNDLRIQAVIVASPTSTHPEVVIAAAQAGKAIFCEKPLALTLPATDEIDAVVQQAGVLLQVGFMRRFDAGYVDAKRKIDAGVIGQPVTIRSIGRDPYRTSLEYADPAISGGLIVDMAIHDLDSIRWLMNDEVQRVYSEVASLVYPELLEVGDVDNAMINLRFEGGSLGNVEVSRTAIYGYDIRCEIVGAEGTLEIGYLRETPVLLMNKNGVTHDVVPHFPQRFGKAYTTQIERFVECLQTDQPSLVTLADARAALQISLAATISHHEERVVYVNEVH